MLFLSPTVFAQTTHGDGRAPVRPVFPRSIPPAPHTDTRPQSNADMAGLRTADASASASIPAIEVKGAISVATADPPVKTADHARSENEAHRRSAPKRAVATRERVGRSRIDGQVIGGTLDSIFVRKANGEVVEVDRGSGKAETIISPSKKTKHRHYRRTRTSRSAVKRRRTVAPKPVRAVVTTETKRPTVVKPSTKSADLLKLPSGGSLFENDLKRFADTKKEGIVPPKRDSFYAIKREGVADPKMTPEGNIPSGFGPTAAASETPDPSRLDSDEGSLFR